MTFQDIYDAAVVQFIDVCQNDIYFLWEQAFFRQWWQRNYSNTMTPTDELFNGVVSKETSAANNYHLLLFTGFLGHVIISRESRLTVYHR